MVKNLGQREEETTKIKDQEIKKILLAIDESEYKGKIIRHGLRLAKSFGSELTALHVIEKSSISALGGLLGYYDLGDVGNYEEELRKRAKELLGEAESLAKEAAVKINIEVIMSHSSAAEGIINYASSTNVDLIVIGTKGMSGAQRFLMGGVANKVMSHAHCSVFAVR